jgi:stage II sporulation protein D
MLLRYLSPLIALSIFFGCKPKTLETQNEIFHKVGVLSLFKPIHTEIIFPQNVLAKLDDNHFLHIPMGNRLFIDLINSHLILRVDEKSYSTANIVFYTENKNNYYDKFRIVIPDKIDRTYFGGLTVTNNKTEITLIILQKTEDLIVGVLSSESNDSEPEYLKALSIIIRTYILFNHNRHTNDGYDFCDNTHCMVFYGEQNKNTSFSSAVKATKGEVLKYDNRLIDVFYTGSCGGVTRTPTETWNSDNSIYPYFPITCTYCANNDHKNWSWKTAKLELSQLFPGSKSIKNIILSKSPNTPEMLNIFTNKGCIHLTKDEFRLSVGRLFGWNKIYSDNYSFAVNKDSIIFIGHGFGHCVGFCQSGAEEMSRQGKTYKDILKFYYPKASL